jgi:putative methyltransferase (TIGR04325 family)
LTLAKAALEIFASDPCRTVLFRLSRIPSGTRFLNAVSGPYGAYLSFEEGWIAARKANPIGHEDPVEIAVHLKHAEALRPSDYAAVYWISRIHLRDPQIFDFGGNVGNLYYSYSPRLNHLGCIRWTVLDIPSVNESGRKIAAERNAPTLQFVDSADAFREEQILLISGAFHYWEKDIPAFLRQFPAVPLHVIINRSPIHETQPSFIAVQRTTTCAFPCRVWNASELISGFEKAGYLLIDHWKALELSLKLPLFPKLSVPHYSGFYFSRSDQPYR